MRNQDDTSHRKRQVGQLFSALKAVVAANPDLQALIRDQEQDNRQVLLNMSSVLRMVERERLAQAQGRATEAYEPHVVAGWMTGEGNLVHRDRPEGPEPAPDGDKPVNFFDRAFLKSLKISS